MFKKFKKFFKFVQNFYKLFQNFAKILIKFLQTFYILKLLKNALQIFNVLIVGKKRVKNKTFLQSKVD